MLTVLRREEAPRDRRASQVNLPDPESSQHQDSVLVSIFKYRKPTGTVMIEAPYIIRSNNFPCFELMQTFRTHQKSDPQNLFRFTTTSSKYKKTKFLSFRELCVENSCKEMGSSERSLSEEHILEFQVEQHLSILRYSVTIKHCRFVQNFSNSLSLAIFSMICSADLFVFLGACFCKSYHSISTPNCKEFENNF